MTTGTSGALCSLLPTNTREEVPDDSPTSPSLLIPVAYMDAIASLHPATTGIPSINPVSSAASFVTVPMMSSIFLIGGITLSKSTPITFPISSDHFIVFASKHCVLAAWSISVTNTPVSFILI